MKEVYYIPKKITIGGKVWKIKIRKEVDEGKALGKCNYEHRTITLEKGWRSIKEALGHELGHAFLFETKFSDNTENNAQQVGNFLGDILSQINIIKTKEKEIKIKKSKKK